MCLYNEGGKLHRNANIRFLTRRSSWERFTVLTGACGTVSSRSRGEGRGSIGKPSQISFKVAILELFLLETVWICSVVLSQDMRDWLLLGACRRSVRGGTWLSLCDWLYVGTNLLQSHSWWCGQNRFLLFIIDICHRSFGARVNISTTTKKLTLSFTTIEFRQGRANLAKQKKKRKRSRTVDSFTHLFRRKYK